MAWRRIKWFLYWNRAHSAWIFTFTVIQKFFCMISGLVSYLFTWLWINILLVLETYENDAMFSWYIWSSDYYYCIYFYTTGYLSIMVRKYQDYLMQPLLSMMTNLLFSIFCQIKNSPKILLIFIFFCIESDYSTTSISPFMIDLYFTTTSSK